MTDSTSLQQYGSFDLEDVDDIDEEMSKGSGAYIKLKVGKNVVRFLPPLSGHKAVTLVWEHQLNLPDGSFVNFACPRLMAKRMCIVCRKADALKTTGNPADFDRAKDLFARRRIYANVIDRADPEAGPKVFAFGKKIWEQIKGLRTDEDVGGDFTHPEEGFDIIVNRTGSTKNDTSYNVIPGRTSELGNLEWIGAQQPVERFAQVLSEEKIRERLGGKADAGGGQKQAADQGGTVVDASFEAADDDEPPF